MSDDPVDLPQGMLDLLILKTLTLEPRHGWAISVRLRQISDACIDIRQGSLYPVSTAWNGAGGSKPRGASPTTIAARNTTRSPNAVEPTSMPKRRVGAG
jgi:hypothetical protein